MARSDRQTKSLSISGPFGRFPPALRDRQCCTTKNPRQETAGDGMRARWMRRLTSAVSRAKKWEAAKVATAQGSRSGGPGLPGSSESRPVPGNPVGPGTSPYPCLSHTQRINWQVL